LPSAPGRPFFNASVGHAMLEDLVALHELARRGGEPGRLILGVDAAYWNARSDEGLWRSLAPVYASARRRLGLGVAWADAVGPFGREYLQLLSPSYFQGSLRQLRLGRARIEPRETSADSGPEPIRRADGTYAYADPGAHRSVAEADRLARERASE